jgi:hypothetical protein
MGNLDEMTKAELLEFAREREISPANAAMSKDELRESIDAALAGEGELGVEGQATTTANADYMGRPLITPSVNSKDYMGRATFSAVDYMGRTLLP